MKAILRWFGRVAAMALALALGIAIVPYMNRLLVHLMPDANASALRTSAILSSKMTQSARLETIQITEEGVMNHDFDVGSWVLAHVTTKYAYNANYGIDLSQVDMIVTGSEIVFVLPTPELMFDEIVELEVDRDTFALGTFSDEDYRELLEQERLICRERYTAGESWQTVLDSTVAAVESTVSAWLQSVDSRVAITYTFAGAAE